MPTISTSGRDTRSSRSAERGGDGAAAVGIVAAVEPELAAGGASATSRPCASRCSRAGQSALAMPGLEGRRRKPRAPDRAQRRDREAGVVELMAAVELRRRQVEQAVVVLIDQPAALLGRASSPRRRSRAARRRARPAARSPRAPRAAARAITAGTPRLRMPAFSAAIFSSVSPRNSAWSSETGVIDARQRMLDHIGGVEPPAEADFEQQHIGRMPREQQEAPPRS